MDPGINGCAHHVCFPVYSSPTLYFLLLHIPQYIFLLLFIIVFCLFFISFPPLFLYQNHMSISNPEKERIVINNKVISLQPHPFVSSLFFIIIFSIHFPKKAFFLRISDCNLALSLQLKGMLRIFSISRQKRNIFFFIAYGEILNFLFS